MSEQAGLEQLLRVAASPRSDPSTAELRNLCERAAERIKTLEACLRCDDESVRTAWAREAALRDAIERYVHAYRERYTKPATRGVRSDAPLRAEVAELNAAACEKSGHSPATAQSHRLADPINTEGK